MTAIDAHAKAVRMGWMPAFPQFDRNPLDLADEAAAQGVEPADHVVAELRRGACTSPSTTRARPSSFPRVFFVWRSNLLGSSGKGQEYFLRHLLGAGARRAARRAAARGRAPGGGARGATRSRAASSTCSSTSTSA